MAKLHVRSARSGMICDRNADVSVFKPKAVSIHWELMFTRSLFQTPDIRRQGEILKDVTGLLDAGRIPSTATESLSAISAANLKRAHAAIESGTARGKLVLEAF